MSFLHPWAVFAGIAAASLPVIVHWLTRPRPVQMPLSTIRFVREVVHQRRARHRLRDLIVLILRTAAVLLIALAIARPQWNSKPLAASDDGGDAIRVVMLDASQSMAVTDGSIQLIERARTAAAEDLRYRPGLRVNLIVAAAAPRAVFEQPSTNFEGLRDGLRQATVLPQRLDVRRALESAAQMLTPTSADDTRRRELVIISDFQRRNWSSADFSVLPHETNIELKPVRTAASLQNLSVLRAECRGRITQGRATRLEVDVGNYSPAPRDATVEVTIGDTSYRVRGHCAAGRVTTLSEEILLRTTGWHWGQARLAGVDDALAADDVRPVVVQVRPKPLYALVTRQPPSLRPSSSHYLECALAPDIHLQDRALARLVRLNPTNLDRETLAPADLIVLDHPGKLDEPAVKLLAGLLRRGRPILYVTSEAVDANNLKQLTESAGRSLQLPVEFAPPPAGRARQNLFLASYRRDDSVLGVFGDQVASAVAPLRFAGGLTSRRAEVGLSTDVLAAYNDGSASLVYTSSDAGTLAILNADLAASNLPASAAFVPMIEELVQRLMVRSRRAGSNFVCGEPLVAQLPAEVGLAAALTIVGPQQEKESAGDSAPYGQLSDDGAGVAWHWPSPTLPGVYRACRGPMTEFALAVSLPDEESQLEPLPMDVLTGRLAGGRAMHVQAASGEGQQDQFWTWLVVACVVCMAGEVGTLIFFRT